MKNIDWTKQHCGVMRATFEELKELMPDLACIEETFPSDVNYFIWDVKVHMLMPKQYPCIPNWHLDNIPRVDGEQDFSLVKTDKPMYLWISNTPLTEFRKDDKSWFIEPQEWIRFYQTDEHRGTISEKFQWRGFIRATHKDILPPREEGHMVLRRHCQVYLDENTFMW